MGFNEILNFGLEAKHLGRVFNEQNYFNRFKITVI